MSGLAERVAAAVAVAVMCLTLASSAAAGTFDVSACKSPAGDFPNHSWVLYATAADFTTRDCDLTDQDPQLLLQSAPNQTYGAQRGATLTFTAPPGTTIANFRWTRRVRHFNPTDNAPAPYTAFLYSLAQLGATELEGTGAYDQAVMDRLGAHGAWATPGQKFGADGSASLGDYSETRGYRGDATTLKVAIGCWVNPCSLMTDDTEGKGTISWGLIGATVTVNDPVAPTIDRVFPTGLDAGNGFVSGDEPVTIDAGDNTGIRRAEVVDVSPGTSQVVGVRDFACDYSYAVPCQNVVAAAQIPVSVPNGGPRSFKVRVTDAAGNVTESRAFGATVVGPLNGTNASGAARLTTTFSGNRSKLVVGFGRRARIRGRLVDATGVPIAGAVVQVLDRELRVGTKYAQRLELTTDANGRFSVLPGPGSARAIRFEYRYRRLLFTANASDTVELRVAAGSTLRVTPSRVRPRGTITLSGRLKGLPLPRSGKVVDLQAYEGGAWRTFDTTRARKNARFTSRYRFVRARSGSSFLIRARIRRDDSYPYYLGYSPRVRVRVR